MRVGSWCERRYQVRTRHPPSSFEFERGLSSRTRSASMRGSLKIATIAGIGLYVHWTFAILILGLPLVYLMSGASPAETVETVGLILAIFGCVALHEYGHALTARRFDVPTRDITLLPIGGLARLQRIPEEPKQELMIAVMGPFVNLVIAGVIFVALAVLGSVRPPDVAFAGLEGSALLRLGWINLALVAFNLLPAFPMDGGRVLRALLAMRMEYARATQIAATMGKATAVMFGFLALFGNFLLLFIALFVYLGAQQEAHYTRIRSVMQGLTVRHAMVTTFQTLTADQTLQDAVQRILDGYRDDFLVMDDGELTGILTKQSLLQAFSERDRSTPVSEVMTTDFAPVQESEMLIEAFEKMRAVESSVVPVLNRDRVVGLLSLEHLGEMMMLGSALKKADVRSRNQAAFPGR